MNRRTPTSRTGSSSRRFSIRSAGASCRACPRRTSTASSRGAFLPSGGYGGLQISIHVGEWWQGMRDRRVISVTGPYQVRLVLRGPGRAARACRTRWRRCTGRMVRARAACGRIARRGPTAVPAGPMRDRSCCEPTPRLAASRTFGSASMRVQSTRTRRCSTTISTTVRPCRSPWPAGLVAGTIFRLFRVTTLLRT